MSSVIPSSSPPPVKNVVIVDDDVEMGRAVGRLVKAGGFTPSVFTSGESVVQANPPADCFIFDIHMPGMSGLDLAERLRADGQRSPIVFITAHDDSLSRERARKAGAAGFVLKPFEGESLLGILTKAMA